MAPWDGLETARQLRRRLVVCPPILFLGEPGLDARPCLPKPFRTTQLVALVEASLDPVY